MKDLVNDGFAQVVKPYIDEQDTKTRKMLAPVEPDETDASQAYEIGDQLILDGILYDVIAPIAQHGIITATGSGANIAVATAFSKELGSLKKAFINQVNNNGAKNLINTKAPTTKTQNATTYTVNADGSVKVSTESGGATATNIFEIGKIKVKQGQTYTISGGLSDDKDYQTQRIWVTSSTAFPAGNRLGTDVTANRTRTALADEEVSVGIQVYINRELTNAMFYPMIRLATDTDDTYVPPAKTNKELTDVAEQIKAGYIYQGIANVEVTADGVKDYQTLLNELLESFKTYADAHTDEYYSIRGLRLNDNVLTSVGYSIAFLYHLSSTIGGQVFIKNRVTSTATVINYIEMSGTLSNNHYRISENGTITAKDSDIPSSGDYFRFYLDVYKKVS